MWRCLWLWLIFLLAAFEVVFIVFYWNKLFSNDARTKVIYSTRNIQENNDVEWAGCSLTKCLDLRKCLLQPDRRISIYVQPILQVFDEVSELQKIPYCLLFLAGNSLDCADRPSIEFLALRKFFLHSSYAEPDPTKACLVIPGVDTLSLLNCPADRVVVLLKAAKSLLPPKSNFLLFNFLISAQYLEQPFPFPAIFASSQHSSSLSFRPAIDLAIPLPNALIDLQTTFAPQQNAQHKAIDILIPLTLSIQRPNDHPIVETFGKATNLFRVKIVVKCSSDSDQPFGDDQMCNPEKGQFISSLDPLVESAKFLLVADDTTFFPQVLVWRALRAGAIPVIITDHFVHPFFDLIDWSRFSFTFVPSLLPHLPTILHRQSPTLLEEMRQAGHSIYTRHFSTFERILTSAVDSIEGKIIPGRARSRREWNLLGDQLQPFPKSAKCPFNPGEKQTIVMMVSDGKNIGGGRLSSTLHQFFSFAKTHNVMMACSFELCDQAMQAIANFYPQIHLISRTFHFERLADLRSTILPSIPESTSSSGPALLLVNTSHPFWSNAHALPFAGFFPTLLQTWSDNCHSLLFYPPANLVNSEDNTFTSSLIGSAFSIVHKYLLTNFLSSEKPFSCISSRLQLDTETAVAMCQMPENC